MRWCRRRLDEAEPRRWRIIFTPSNNRDRGRLSLCRRQDANYRNILPPQLLQQKKTVNRPRIVPVSAIATRTDRFHLLLLHLRQSHRQVRLRRPLQPTLNPVVAVKTKRLEPQKLFPTSCWHRFWVDLWCLSLRIR